jgi:hypothetical protein
MDDRKILVQFLGRQKIPVCSEMSRQVFSFSYSEDMGGLYPGVIFGELENHSYVLQAVRSTCVYKLHYDLHYHRTRRDTDVFITCLLL